MFPGRSRVGDASATWPRYRDAPAAKRYHQAYRHGLLEHCLTVAQAVSAISATIHDRLARLRASVTVSAPSTRLHEDLITQIAEATMRTAAAIGKQLA